MEQWIEAVKFLISSSENADVKLAAMITTQNTSIPIIEANEKDSILQFINLDSTKSANDISYVQRKLKQFKSQNNAVVWVDPFDSTKRNLSGQVLRIKYSTADNKYRNYCQSGSPV